MLEWKGDPEGSMRGCGFFHFQEEQIILQRGYWDQLSFMQQQNQIK
jgi:limonene-1,2-epoxide hydrolase